MPSSYCDINNNPNIDVAKSAAYKTCIQTNGSICATPADQACYYSYMLGKSREKLDSDLQEIHRPETSRAYTFQSNLETTMLTGIVWAMLGTTVLYYAFTKI
jgi:hypothetical protein